MKALVWHGKEDIRCDSNGSAADLREPWRSWRLRRPEVPGRTPRFCEPLREPAPVAVLRTRSAVAFVAHGDRLRPQHVYGSDAREQRQGQQNGRQRADTLSPRPYSDTPMRRCTA